MSRFLTAKRSEDVQVIIYCTVYKKIQSSIDVDENQKRKTKTHSNLHVPMRWRFKGSHQTKEEAEKSRVAGSIIPDDSLEEATMSRTFGPDKYVKHDNSEAFFVREMNNKS